MGLRRKSKCDRISTGVSGQDLKIVREFRGVRFAAIGSVTIGKRVSEFALTDRQPTGRLQSGSG
jgi:hypothetical protein